MVGEWRKPQTFDNDLDVVGKHPFVARKVDIKNPVE
jgi:hypothetical protein